jgi:ChrR-like protein with cupin domain
MISFSASSGSKTDLLIYRLRNEKNVNMRGLLCLAVIGSVACSLVAQEQASSNTPPVASPSQSEIVAAPESITWHAGGNGTEFAVLSGSPSADGEPFVIRLRFADKTQVAPHWHPVDEHITVIAGTFYMGMGEKFNESAAKEMPTGSYGFMPKEMRHFGWAKGTTIIQIHGIGPFKTNWVDSAEKPTTN